LALFGALQPIEYVIQLSLMFVVAVLSAKKILKHDKQGDFPKGGEFVAS